MDATERRARATQEATQWWHRLGSQQPAEIPRADREEFVQWLRESPLHVAELLNVAHVHDALERFQLWGEVESTGTASADEDNIVHLREPGEVAPPAGDSRTVPPSGSRSGAHGHQVRTWAIAAGACVVAIAAGWLAFSQRGEVISTDRAERRQVVLDDGSVVQVEPETTLRVRFKANERAVLLEHGSALFRVAKDARRPFWVQADRTVVRAVGTAFGVEHRARGIIVTVAEGKVAVREGSSADAASTPSAAARAAESSSVNASATELGKPGAAPQLFLTAGQQVTVERSGHAAPVRSVDATRALAWAQGRLVFEDDTLGDVVAAFNRYNRTQIHLADAALAARRVSGVFEATDPETLLAFVQAGSRVSVVRDEQSITVTSIER